MWSVTDVGMLAVMSATPFLGAVGICMELSIRDSQSDYKPMNFLSHG